MAKKKIKLKSYVYLGIDDDDDDGDDSDEEYEKPKVLRLTNKLAESKDKFVFDRIRLANKRNKRDHNNGKQVRNSFDADDSDETNDSHEDDDRESDDFESQLNNNIDAFNYDSLGKHKRYICK